MAENEGKGGAGGDGGAGNGAGDADKPLTRKDVEAFFGEKFNSAWTDREKQAAKRSEKALEERFEKFGGSFMERIGQTLDERLEKQGASLEERLKALRGAADKANDKAAADGKSEIDIENHPSFQALKKQQEEAAKDLAEQKRLAKKHNDSLAEERAKREAAEAKSRAEQLVTRTTATLTSKEVGVAPDRVKVALTYLKAEGRVAYGDKGKGDDLVFVQADGEEIPLAEGLAAWAKTEDAEIFLPPKAVGGSGSVPSGGRRRGAPPPNVKPEERMREATKGILAKALIGR